MQIFVSIGIGYLIGYLQIYYLLIHNYFLNYHLTDKCQMFSVVPNLIGNPEKCFMFSGFPFSRE